MGLRRKTDIAKRQEIRQPQGTQEVSYGQSTRTHSGEVELDAIERLKSNILMLDDLQQRLRFMNNELESVIGSKKKN